MRIETPPRREKGVSSQKIPISNFLTRGALFWGGGKWWFFDSETPFPDLGVLALKGI